MKSTIGQVFPVDAIPYTEDGKPIDAIFGAKSIAARIVESTYLIGTTSALLRTIGEQAAKIYFGK